MLVGKYLHNVDTKGRVFVPAKFRTGLGDKFYMLRSIDGCIRAYNEEEFSKMMARVNSATLRNVNSKRKLLASVVEVDMDSQGRVVLSEELRASVGITDKVSIIGMGEWVELWQPELAASLIEEDDDGETFDFLDLAGF
ncbi:MAG: division/cell wall cluster transcriptional repressor MraZ [Ruminococcaceae bacterium]|nr:division/cell wall cluster transcriptional repressor MraZ [Oscillospiraceae bacterium]